MEIRTNKNAEKLKVGDLVTTDFYPYEKNIVRKITNIYKSEVMGSGYSAIVDGGERCKQCGRRSIGIGPVDAGWLIPVYLTS